MNGILMALFGTLGTFLITALGAAGIFLSDGKSAEICSVDF